MIRFLATLFMLCLALVLPGAAPAALPRPFVKVTRQYTSQWQHHRTALRLDAAAARQQATEACLEEATAAPREGLTRVIVLSYYFFMADIAAERTTSLLRSAYISELRKLRLAGSAAQVRKAYAAENQVLAVHFSPDDFCEGLRQWQSADWNAGLFPGAWGSARRALEDIIADEGRYRPAMNLVMRDLQLARLSAFKRDIFDTYGSGDAVEHSDVMPSDDSMVLVLRRR